MTIHYGKQVPFLNDYLKVPCMKRLQGVGMNCGMNYTQFPIFKNIPFYSRYQHSLGCAIATYHFTHDKRQTLASLFHDVATPVFAHTIDFMTGDYLHQEATEKNTTTLLQNDAILMALLERDHIKLSQIDNYHIYPICDNKTPRLSIDRLEYTLDNAYYYGFASPGTLQACFDDLYVGHNEDGEKELTFAHQDIALTFALLALQCGHVYMSDNDRYSMDRLGRLTKKALEEGIITMKDLYTTEDLVIAKLKDAYLKEWQDFTHLDHLVDHPTNGRMIVSKKRYIIPLVDGSRLNHPRFLDALEAFQNFSFDHLLAAEDDL